MPTSLSLEKLLTATKLLYLTLGYLPLDAEADLVEAGCIVEELKARWDREAA